MKILWIDTETTGVNAKTCAVIEIAAVLEIYGTEVSHFHEYMRPHEGAEISQEALEIQGLTLEQIQAFEDPRFIHRKFVAWLSQYISKFDKSDKAFMAAYNAHFDDEFIRAWFDRCNDKYLGSWKWADLLDLRVLAVPYLAHKRHLMPNFKLESVAKEILGAEYQNTMESIGGNLHNALTDIRLTQAFAKRMMGEFFGKIN